ncbi:MlaA family lipoprotein [Thermomonas sp.]
MTRPTCLHYAALLSLVLLASACANGGGVRPGADTATLVPADSTIAAEDAQPGTEAIPVSPAPSQPDADLAGAGVSTSMAPAQGREEPTPAERDYSAIYEPDHPTPDAIAGGSVPAPYTPSQPFDPWERFNRRVYAFNAVVDRNVTKPLAKTYARVVPQRARSGVSNFFNNLGQPATIVNALLQGKGQVAMQSMARFALNTTVGIVGIFDPAARVNLPNRREDLGQTLGVWGWKRSRFIELPLFGPSTVRDTFGLVGNATLSPVRYIEDDKTRIFLRGLGLIDLRTRLFPLDDLLLGASDEYTLVRDSWLQRRDYQIFGGRNAKIKDGEPPLPEYLRDDDNPAR